MELLKIYVNLLETQEVLSQNAVIRMISFDGYAQGEYFSGEIQKGGVDTQIIKEGRTSLSARYILKGIDDCKEPCQIFIENNAQSDGEITDTTPVLYTDSKSLKWIEDEKWRGRMESIDGQLVITIERADSSGNSANFVAKYCT